MMKDWIKEKNEEEETEPYFRQKNFIKIGEGMYINRDNIDFLDGNRLHLKNGDIYKIRDKYINDFRKLGY